MKLRRSHLALVVCLGALGAAGAYLKNESAGTEMIRSAQSLLESLDENQRATATLGYDSPERLDWHFIPKPTRKGLQLREMTEAQRKRAHGLLAACLSQLGYKKADTIMELESILHKLEGEGSRFKRDPLKYYVTVFGEPAADARWGLSVEGHHLSLNFVVAGGKIVSSTPQFLGANPGVVMAEYDAGPKKGTRVLAKEETLAFELVNSLDEGQLKAATIAEEAPRDVRSAGEPQPPQTPPAGVAADKLSDKQRELLQALLETYAESMPATVAQERLSAIEKAGFGKVHFAWAGAREPGIGHYYRIQGPTFLIEFCNTQPDAAGNPANHIHCFWRDVNGDFAVPVGKRS